MRNLRLGRVRGNVAPWQHPDHHFERNVMRRRGKKTDRDQDHVAVNKIYGVIYEKKIQFAPERSHHS